MIRKIKAGAISGVLLALVMLPPPDAQACRGPELETFLFFSTIPGELPDKSFIGTVKLLERGQRDAGAPWLTDIPAQIIESRTHAHLAGQTIALVFPEHSCGPHRATPDYRQKIDGSNAPVEMDSGLIAGRISPSNGVTVLMSYETRIRAGKK